MQQHSASRLLILLLSFLVLGALSGCTRSHKPSYILVAVDQLGFSDVKCNRDLTDVSSGMGILCNESVRWTHAYTTSVLSGPALSSLLTGLHPIDTGYRHNGHHLSPSFQNIGQVAYMNHYRTIFFSGGPPVLKKSGLGKGFESFDDSVNLLETPWLKPFRTHKKTFVNWVDDFNEQPIFAVFYVPDLRFIHRSTTNLEGDPRNKSFESQLEEFDSVLFELIQYLKKAKRWDNTHFILVGLQGRNLYDRRQISSHANLHSESTHVAFLWKPAQTKRDAPVTWTMDRNVSLADVGNTFFDLLGQKTRQGKLEGGSLAISLTKPESAFRSSRFHLVESAWAEWRLGTSIQSALILDDELFFHKIRPVVYRTLSDRLEINPIFSDSSTRETFQLFEKTADELELSPYLEPILAMPDIWGFSYWDWLSPRLENIKNAYSTVPWGKVKPEMQPWLARALIESSDWRGLKSAAESWKNDRLLWLAHRHLGLLEVKTDGCLNLAFSNVISGEDSKKCSDSHFLEVINSLHSDSKSRRWEKILEEKLILTSVLRMNRALGMAWDVPESFESILSLTELFFWSPDYRNQLRSVQHRLRSIELETTQPEGL